MIAVIFYGCTQLLVIIYNYVLATPFTGLGFVDSDNLFNILSAINIAMDSSIINKNETRIGDRQIRFARYKVATFTKSKGMLKVIIPKASAIMLNNGRNIKLSTLKTIAINPYPIGLNIAILKK